MVDWNLIKAIVLTMYVVGLPYLMKIGNRKNNKKE